MWTTSTVLAFAAAGAAAAGAGLWQLHDYRAHRETRLAAHARHGLALLDAAEAVAIRECRGGRTHLDDLAAALDQTREVFGLQWLAIGPADGEPLAAAGNRPDPVDPRHLFSKPFAPLLPNPVGRGPYRPGGTAAVTLPPGLALSLATRPDELELRLAEDRLHAVVTASALGAALLLFAGAAALRVRAAALHADLARSEARLESLETLRRLGAGLAHETRNPLGVVRGLAERLAARHREPDEVARAARAIVDETDRTVARLEEFMLLSRPAALRRTDVAVRALFEELATLLRPDLDAAGATLSIACGDVTIDADREQLRRLLMNLLLNAVQAVEPGGRIELGCAPDAGGVRLTVDDDGPGVPEALRATLFEPYVSGRAGGTGLGLSIARRIATDHGFELHHEPRQPRGTRMVLGIPRRAKGPGRTGGRGAAASPCATPNVGR